MHKNLNVRLSMKKWSGYLVKGMLTATAVLFINGSVFAQTTKVTLNRTETPVQTVLNDIEKQTDYLFVYNNNQLDFNVTVNVENQPVNTVLNRIFADTAISYKLEGKHIVLSKKNTVAPKSGAPLKISGKVLDAQGQPIHGATVVVKDTSNGTITDETGAYTLNATTGCQLEVAFLGYATEIVAVGTRTSVNITLKEDAQALEDVVVVGYGSVKKRDLVGAVDMVNSKVLEDRSTGTLARALQGQLPGMNLTFADSKPTRSASLNVRGSGSIGAGGSSLVLIDGVEGDLNSINPQDVESVSVLKDASSAAVYGARGAFGVVLVTTKSAEKGTPKINYNGAVSMNRRTVIPDLVTDGYTWMTWWKDCYNSYYRGTKALPNHVDSTVPYTEAIYKELERRRGDKTLATATKLDGHSMFGYAYYDSTDWHDLFYKDYNWSTEHNLSISGGGDRADYYISGRYFGNDGIYRVGDDDYKKYDVRAKGSLKVRPWLRIRNNISVSIVNSHEPKTNQGNSQLTRLLNHTAMPLSPVKNPDGSWTAAAAKSGYASFVEGTSWRKDDYIYLRNKFDVDIDIVKDVLKLQADYSYNFTHRKLNRSQQMVQYSTGPGVFVNGFESSGAYLETNDYETRYQSANAYLNWSPKLGEDHNFRVLAGWNVEANDYEVFYIKRKDFVVGSKPTYALMTGETSDPQVSGNEWSYMGAFFRVNYGYKGRYLFEVSGRYDGSSKFPQNSKWGFFPSVSAAWRIADEPWMDATDNWLDNLKLRLSVGSMGNGNVSPYSYTSTMSIATNTGIVLGGSLPSYTTVGGTVPVSLTWETSTTYDVGLDVEMFKNRLSLSADYFHRYTTDMFTQSVSLPSVYGTTPPKGNNAELKTMGWEVSVSWRDQFKLAGKPFEYDIKAMVWDSRSYVTKFYNETKSLGTVGDYMTGGCTPSTYYEGMELGEMWGWTVAGLFKDQADIDSSADHSIFQQEANKATLPGQVKIKDLNGDGVINAGAFTKDDHGDLSIIGNINPHYMFGVNLGARWNGIGLSVFLQGVMKRDWHPGTDAGYFWGKYARPFMWVIGIHDYTNPKYAKTIYSEELDNWDTAYWPRLSTYQANQTVTWARLHNAANTRYTQNAAYMRVKNIQIDYSFPKSICEKIRLQSLKVYLSGENLFTATPLHKWAPNYDPEALGNDPDYSTGQGDGYGYPVTKSLTLGVNITF